ncbi:hypothetical protein EU245_08500 [Lentibacillus lipolyticus]|nr:hypothetical protein EU245_08500 [Lentibacillus lipolyticus]
MEKMNPQFVPSTPKRNNRQIKGKEGFFDFYPGYSDRFVKDVLHYWQLPKNSVVLDPWNGSGTTTDVTSDLGYHALGYDLNPVMFVVAKAREVKGIQHLMLDKSKQKIMGNTASYSKQVIMEEDPLDEWFSSESVNTIRAIEHSIQSIYAVKHGKLLNHKDNLLSLSSEAAFFYLALFRVLKILSSSYRSSNPTWIKKPKYLDDRVRYSRDFILGTFSQQVDELLELLRQEEDYNNYPGENVLGISSSEHLPRENNSVDAIITSPPYCTRIDYAILTRLELALLGSNDYELTKLRKQLIGSPLTQADKTDLNPEWGMTCLNTLNEINDHESKASNTYYLRTFVQYFNGLYKSLLELDRVLKRGGKCAFVVQDSYYKDIHVNLGTIMDEMGKSLLWSTTHQFDFYTGQTMSHINTKSNKYRSKTKGRETVLFFQKRG